MERQEQREEKPAAPRNSPTAHCRMAPSATGLVGVHGFDLARDAVVELQVLVCECARSEVAQIVDSLRCVSEGAEHSGVNFPGFAVLIFSVFRFKKSKRPILTKQRRAS